MKKLFVFLFAAVMFTISAQNITVYRTDKETCIQSRFSDTHDIVIVIFRIANEKSYLVPRGSDIRNYRRHKLMHYNGDEYPATSVGHYSFLSGNHGSAFARLITAKDHGFVMADSGKIITDARKNRYIIVKTIDKDKFVIHPLKSRKNAAIGRASFFRHSNQKLYFQNKEIKFSASKTVQLYPLNLIHRNEFLIDGKTPLPKNTVVKCRFLDHVFDHDVIAPEAAVDYIRKKSNAATAEFFEPKFKMFDPKAEPGFEDYTKLPVIMKIKNCMRYENNGAMVNYRSTTFPYSLSRVAQLEVMFGWFGAIAKGNHQKFYIPKTKPMELAGRRNRNEKFKFDFVKGADITTKADVNDNITPEKVLDKNNPPDRFIRVTGKNSPEHGIALGYSLFMGNSALKNRGLYRPSYYHYWYTKKMYPYAYTLRNNKPGMTVDTVSYKQYFSAKNDPDATYFYYHTQGKHTVVYFETHKTLKNKRLNLPAKFAGQKFSIIEKTPSVTLHASGKVPEDGIKLDIKSNHGYVVLKIEALGY